MQSVSMRVNGVPIFAIRVFDVSQANIEVFARIQIPGVLVIIFSSPFRGHLYQLEHQLQEELNVRYRTLVPWESSLWERESSRSTVSQSAEQSSARLLSCPPPKTSTPAA